NPVSLNWHLVDTVPRLPVTSWSYVALTYDGAELKLYSNGQEFGTAATGPIEQTEGPLEIGGYGRWARQFKGRIDEVRIYRRALSAAEIAIDRNKPVVAGALPDTTPPVVTLTSPSAGAASGLLSLDATASDAGGLVTVQFFVDGQPVSDPSEVAPYH